MASAASPTRDSTSTQPLIVPDPGTSTAAAVVLDSFARAASNTDSLGPWEYAALHAGAALKGAEAGAVDGVDGLADAVGMLLTPETEKSACDWTPAQEDSRRHSCCCCCLSGEAEARPVRLVPGFDDEDGKVAQLHFDVLRRAKVIPDSANPSSFANTLQLSTDLSALLSQRRLTLVPHRDQLAVRLAFEYTYQLSRLRSLASPSSALSAVRHPKRPRIPARPDFEHHYAALERQGAIVRPFLDWTCAAARGVFERRDERGVVRKYRLNSVDEAFELSQDEGEGAEAAKDAPPIPWFRLPCSMNLVLYAMADRLQQNAPAPEAVQEETEALATGTRLLLTFWHLTSSTPTLTLSSLLARTKTWLTTQVDSSALPRFIDKVDVTVRAEEFLTPTPGYCVEGGWGRLERASQRARESVLGRGASEGGGAASKKDRIAALLQDDLAATSSSDKLDSTTSTPGSHTPSTSAAPPTAEQKERQDFVRAWMAQLAS